MSVFTEVQPSLENYWRSLILFGRNVASYKFALGKCLLELAEQGQEVVPVEALAEPFARHVCDHLQLAEKQGTSPSSQFLAVCRKFNAGEVTSDQLRATTVRLGFTNVIDAFHVLHGGAVGVRFFVDERRGREGGIRLTDNLFQLGEQYQYRNLPREVEARWRLVETAWELSLPRHVLTVGLEPGTGMLVVNNRRLERKAITGCREALNGYQKGKCFYCFADISVAANAPDLGDVDHFFPHLLKPHGLEEALDGIWNLVLACSSCNRGPTGKFARLPSLKHLERLHQRNSFLIGSHHPLRETLMQQTGASEPERKRFLQYTYRWATELLIHQWQPKFEYEPAF